MCAAQSRLLTGLADREVRARPGFRQARSGLVEKKGGQTAVKPRSNGAWRTGGSVAGPISGRPARSGLCPGSGPADGCCADPREVREALKACEALLTTI